MNTAQKTVFTVLLTLYLFISYSSQGQRAIDYSQFSTAWFDSVRARIYDNSKEHYIINAYRLNRSDRIKIDGRLDEPAWTKAEHKGDLLEKEPFPLIPMNEQTEFAILYDDENLYIGVWCYDSEPNKIVRQLAPRGTVAPDHLMLFIDSYHDHRTGYKFVVSPTGVQVDELRYDDIKRDGSWNGIWYSEGFIDEKGWYAELKIPFFNFRYSSDEKQIWGFNIMRTISKDASRGQWKPHLPEWDNTTRMSQMGHIENINKIKPGRTFELRPYGVAGATKSATRKTVCTGSIGGDIRYSPGPNLTADFTINPDFAQVDADVFEINLTRYPTRFNELRPFFTERINIFNTPRELFYSRRVGAKGDILGGVKMTGKINNGIEFGILGNITGNSFFSNYDRNGEKAFFGVARIKKDIFKSGTIGLLTATKEESGSFNRTFGVDGSITLSNYNIVDFQISKGQIESGPANNMAYNFSYMRTGDKIGASIIYDRIEPAFEINRIGYIQKEADRGWSSFTGSIRYSPRINKHHIRRISTNLIYRNTTDIFTDIYINRWLALFPEFTPAPEFGTIEKANEGKRFISGGIRDDNNFSVTGDLTINMINEMSLQAEFKQFSNTELTGRYHGNFLKTAYSTRPLSLGTRIAGILSAKKGTYYNFTKKYAGKQKGVSLTGESYIGYNVLTSLEADFTKTYNPGKRNDGNYFKLSSNTTLMFTKDFYFRLHAQGIFGTTYYDIKQINNEYLVSCLLSWEYRPGSFLYLAYNENRFDFSDPGYSKFMAFNNRTVLLKLSYFFSL
ncbi:MAG: carbohydrate binding family 9 domain-containing protein [Bacteroidales bacterium]|nr:carbohydrate binding family 9 domain-containing protein [Bacteroidales bacterium]